MIKDRTFQILFLLVVLLLGIAWISAANLNLGINGFINGYSSDIKLKTNPFAISGYDAYDFIVLFNPDNYSSFFSIIPGPPARNFSIDTWSANPRDLQLCYKMPSSQTGTITFLWNSLSGTGYKGIFTYYGTDSGFTIPIGARNMTVYTSYSNSLAGNSQVYAGVSVEDIYPKFGTMNTTIYACEGSYLSYMFNVSDEVGAAPSISVSPMDPFYTIYDSNIDAITDKYKLYSGILNKTSAGGKNIGIKNYSEAITANNGKNSNTTYINVTVIEINNAPSVTDLSDSLVSAGTAFYKRIYVNDAEDGDQDSENLSFSLIFSGAALFNISSNGTISSATSASNVGVHNVTVCVADNGILHPYSDILSKCGEDGSSKTSCKSFWLTISSSYVGPQVDSGGGGGGTVKNTPEKNKTVSEEDKEVNLSTEGEKETPEKKDMWDCEEWSECSAIYGLGDLISGSVFLNGEQKRICRNVGTRKQRIEKQECDAKESIVAKKSRDCFKDYVEVFNQDGQMVSRLELANNRLNIQMIVDKPAYCPYCYNGIKDYDEEDVDCGGSCGDCYARVYSIAGIERIIFFIVFLMILAFVDIAIFLIFRNYALKHELARFPLEKRKI